MRDMLFAMPLGPMPGPKVEAPTRTEAETLTPAKIWKLVEGNPQVEVNGLGQMRTCMALPGPGWQDMAMMDADEPMRPLAFYSSEVTAGFMQDVERMTRKMTFGDFGLDTYSIFVDPATGGDETSVVLVQNNEITMPSAQIIDQPVVGKPFGLGSIPSCHCDSCNQWRKLGR